MLCVRVRLGKTDKYQTQITEKVQDQGQEHYVFNLAHDPGNTCRRVCGMVLAKMVMYLIMFMLATTCAGAYDAQLGSFDSHSRLA